MKYILFSLLAIVLVAGCSVQDREHQAIEAVMLKRQQAMHSKDIESYLSLISPQYNDNGQEFAAKKKEFISNFASFDGIDYRSDGYQIRVAGDRAIVSGRYGLKIVKQGQVLRLQGKEELQLRKERQVWRIIGGL